MKNNNLSPKVSETLSKIVELFKSGEGLPKAISIATFPKFDVPSNLWSLSNRIIMALNGTSDARGFKQWNEVNRYAKKGSKAFYILAPWLARKGNISARRQEEDIEEVGKPVHISQVLRGFLAIPVFKVEDTEGEKLDYQNLELPRLPLLDVAKSWGIDVAPVAYQGSWLGYYAPNKDEIRLATPHEKTFFHELSHAAHQRVNGGLLKSGQDWKQEIVAELCAQTLCHVFGRAEHNTTGNSFEYISHYALKANRDVGVACVSVLGEVEKVLSLIVGKCSRIEDRSATLHGISMPGCQG